MHQVAGRDQNVSKLRFLLPVQQGVLSRVGCHPRRGHPDLVGQLRPQQQDHGRPQVQRRRGLGGTQLQTIPNVSLKPGVLAFKLVFLWLPRKACLSLTSM